jgi:hypothetical protein
VPARDRGGVIVEIAGSATVERIVRYHADPWFWRATRQRDVHVLLDRAGRATVWQVRASQSV